MVTIPTIKIVPAGGVVYGIVLPCFTHIVPDAENATTVDPVVTSHGVVFTKSSSQPPQPCQKNKASRSKVPAGNQKLVVPPALQLWSAVKVLENGYTLSTSMQTFGGIIHVSRIRVCSCLFILRSKLIFRNCPKGSKGTPFRQCVVFIGFGSWWFWPKAFSWEILAWKRLREILPNLALSIGL